MIKKMRLKPSYNVLEAPYIRVEATITQPGITNGKPNIFKKDKYIVAPSAKKISTYIVNQIFGSDLVTQTEGLNINWLMPTLKESLSLAVYEQESFIFIRKYDEKIYLECIKKSDIHDLVQKFDKVISGTIIEEIPGEDNNYELHRHFEIENGITYLYFTAYSIDSSNKLVPIDLSVFNARTNNEYEVKYVLPYEIIINIDTGEDFFKDSKHFISEEMEIFNTFADEIEKTRTRIVTSQHYQSGDIVTNWVPGNTHYKVETLSVNKLQDYFTLLPGDKDHQLFEFLQGNIRFNEYISSFKFCDYQIIQMAGLSPTSFGYEKDAYQNVDSVDLSKNNSDMTIEAIKTQIEPQINKLLENVVKAQTSNNIKVNVIPKELSWDYGANEKITDMKKIQILSKIQSVGSIPYSIKAKIILPILKKLIEDNLDKKDMELLNSIIDENKKEQEDIKIDFGEV